MREELEHCAALKEVRRARAANGGACWGEPVRAGHPWSL